MGKNRVLSTSLYRIFRPLARILVRHGFTVQDIVQVLKQAYVDVAREEYGVRGRPTSKARIAALTGLTRVEVARLVESPKTYLDDVGSKNPVTRLIGHWLRDKEWQTVNGQPRDLDTVDTEHGFPALVRKVGGDLPYQTILKEMERLKLVIHETGTVRLIKHGFVPDVDELKLLPFIGEDIPALIEAIGFNLRSEPANRRYQRKVAFPGLTPEGMELLQKTAATDGQKLLESLDKGLANYALDETDSKFHQTGLGIYVFDIEHEPLLAGDPDDQIN